MRSPLPLLLLFAAACGPKGPGGHNDSVLQARDTLTRHQKDSIVAHSAVPGASVVGKAMTVQDSGASHAAAIDSAGREP